MTVATGDIAGGLPSALHGTHDVYPMETGTTSIGRSIGIMIATGSCAALDGMKVGPLEGVNDDDRQGISISPWSMHESEMTDRGS
jgi:hypothetical protein